MSRQNFSDDCPGCRPALWDIETRKVIPEDAPIMQTILAVWGRTSREEREVFHRVTCLNTPTTSDLRIFQAISTRMQNAITAMPKET